MEPHKPEARNQLKVYSIVSILLAGAVYGGYSYGRFMEDFEKSLGETAIGLIQFSFSAMIEPFRNLGEQLGGSSDGSGVYPTIGEEMTTFPESQPTSYPSTIFGEEQQQPQQHIDDVIRTYEINNKNYGMNR